MDDPEKLAAEMEAAAKAEQEARALAAKLEQQREDAARRAEIRAWIKGAAWRRDSRR